MKNESLYLYPVWLRIWHWLNALLFLSLIFTGLNLQYAKINSPIIDFHTAILIHNISGITLTLNYLFFFILNIISGNYKHYLPKLKNFAKNMLLQLKFYLSGIFKNEEHPFETSANQKFNPLQQITYLNIMYALFPLLLITGWALLFPEFILNKLFETSGLLLTAVFHTTIGFLLSIFMIGHIYLATTGTTILSNFKSMLTGWHVHENHIVKSQLTEITIQQVKNENEN